MCAEQRRQPPYRVTMPIMVNGVDSAGHTFRARGETLNRSTRGMGLLLGREPSLSSRLLISILHNHRRIQLETEVRHVTTFDSKRKLVGVRFLIQLPVTSSLTTK
jgi:hypothetical protein